MNDAKNPSHLSGDPHLKYTILPSPAIAFCSSMILGIHNYLHEQYNTKFVAQDEDITTLVTSVLATKQDGAYVILDGECIEAILRAFRDKIQDTFRTVAEKEFKYGTQFVAQITEELLDAVAYYNHEQFIINREITRTIERAVARLCASKRASLLAEAHSPTSVPPGESVQPEEPTLGADTAALSRQPTLGDHVTETLQDSVLMRRLFFIQGSSRHSFAENLILGVANAINARCSPPGSDFRIKNTIISRSVPGYASYYVTHTATVTQQRGDDSNEMGMQFLYTVHAPEAETERLEYEIRHARLVVLCGKDHEQQKCFELDDMTSESSLPWMDAIEIHESCQRGRKRKRVKKADHTDSVQREREPEPATTPCSRILSTLKTILSLVWKAITYPFRLLVRLCISCCCANRGVGTMQRATYTEDSGPKARSARSSTTTLTECREKTSAQNTERHDATPAVVVHDVAVGSYSTNPHNTSVGR
ncbi:hypothetical protein [Anaplasma capra]|uniref:hypothetical protein n=1 Tax=Anaplasma capra TaxID=1562740 RepID=UPI0021D5DB9F|nr:hypothetical protein [Anaplasma capra]MCU7611400.1 hypothetical protein [Anaplasma capra]MCU7612161.1 hypothetical protein [Anaplasma capra]